MKTKDFKVIYENAKKVDIKHNEWFNVAGWFWLNLTDKQLQKMWDLLLEQNHLCKGTKHITLSNGVKILNPYN